MATTDQEMVILRDRDRIVQATVDDWTSLTVLGSLSADPRSIEELARAWLRYRPDSPLFDLPWGELPEAPPSDQPWIVCDLVSGRLVAGAGAQLPESPAAYRLEERASSGRERLVWVNLPPRWQCVDADWQSALLPISQSEPPLDFRQVLVGRPFAEDIARRTYTIARQDGLPAAWSGRSGLTGGTRAQPCDRSTRQQWHALTARVHADWLMTPRADLHHQPPRTFLHQGRAWVEREMQNRQSQWSLELRAPRPIDRDTFCYRYGPPGLHEVIVYFELCREVIAVAWELLSASPHLDQTKLADRLQARAEEWLQRGQIDDDDPLPPAQIVDSERRRMPLTSDRESLDSDCPMCQMSAAPGREPSFIMYDGHHLELEDVFAFSLTAERDDWEEERELLGGYDSGDMDCD